MDTTNQNIGRDTKSIYDYTLKIESTLTEGEPNTFTQFLG